MDADTAEAVEKLTRLSMVFTSLFIEYLSAKGIVDKLEFVRMMRLRADLFRQDGETDLSGLLLALAQAMEES